MRDSFSTTRWSLIVAASGDDSGAYEALEELCRAYWPPVYAFMRRHGRLPDDAADLTQAFFVQVLERRSFARADPAKGRFRAYLLTSARNFLVNAHERDVAARRGGGAPHLAIDVAGVERALALDTTDDASSPHAVFERQWAIRLMERTLKRLREEYVARGQGATFEELQPLLTSNTSAQTPPPTPAAVRPAMTSDARRTAVHRLRVRFGELLRNEVADTVGDLADVDDELRHVLQILSG